eukprot:gnl/MRDRNA2_/MRDRNA2_477248_c0_seq1.p1 gnl/MRDRNA2_/MRDRNA2_477248_c0~~gnl/MRDRNA2_/MRDRNA2_477248_c0_seq1.p1  ORF type:complete len:107 (-),score=19.68 gnl/MRDRNA2_/MRDRNA2_477248_c0_seq1:77-355(-)
MEEPIAHKCMGVLGLADVQPKELFSLLNCGNGRISADDFINGVMMIRRQQVNAASSLIINRRLETLMKQLIEMTSQPAANHLSRPESPVSLM